MSAVSVYSHAPVLVEQVLQYLLPRPGGVYCDVTVGGGGHAEQLLLASAPSGSVLGIDRDPQAVQAARDRLARFGPRFVALHGRFSELPELLRQQGVGRVNGILADIGVSSPQLDRAERGFSFRQPGPIDMRMDPSAGESARELIERLPEQQLEEILRHYGEERFARRIAASIKEAAARGELLDTVALAQAVVRAIPMAARRPGRDLATRSFQALRIAVNDELRELDSLLRAAPSCLAPGGRLVVIAFHSLEDRIVKHGLRAAGLTTLTKKAVWPGESEAATNPRARSARLRAAARAEAA